MRTTTWRRVAIAAVGLLLSTAVGTAGTLTLTWRASDDEVTAGYDIEVRHADGSLLRTVDAGAATRLELRDLADDTPLFFSIRPYDRAGLRARKGSDPLVTFANPRVDRVSGDLRVGESFKLQLTGANFADGARVAVRKPGVVVVSTTVIRPDAAIVELRSATLTALLPVDFTVANPVRRAAEYLEAHPELLDVDQSGTVDEADWNRLSAAFGANATEPGVDAGLDLTGDGVIDAEDAAPVRAWLNRNAPPPRREGAP